jgi:ABC-2 type transport system ATP-binding protein
MPLQPLIQVQDLTKTFRVPNRQVGFLAGVRHLFSPSYRNVEAVRAVTFSVQAGELVGYLGPNGAGKSTTLKMLTGLLVPTGGRVVVGGMVPWRDRTRYVARIGAVFGQRSTLWWDLPVADSLSLQQALYRVEPARFHRNLDEFRAMLDLDEFLDSPVRSLSLGQRMRAELCAALLHEPPLVFLDEPTIGLDVVAKERIRQFIRYVNREKATTVILTTHDLADVERLCERVIILDQGRILFDGQLSTLVEQFETSRLMVITLAGEAAPVTLPGLEPPDVQGLQVTYTFQPRRTPAAELLAQVNAYYPVADLEIRRPPLENTIRRIYEERLLDPQAEIPRAGD